MANVICTHVIESIDVYFQKRFLIIIISRYLDTTNSIKMFVGSNLNINKYRDRQNGELLC